MKQTILELNGIKPVKMLVFNDAKESYPQPGESRLVKSRKLKLNA